MRALVATVVVAASTFGGLAVAPLAPTAPAGAAPVVVPSIDPTSRASVLAAYRTTLLEARNVATGWTGNASTCTKGTESAASIEATRAAINFYRGLNGLGPVTMDATLNGKALSAALMMHANNQLDHEPPSSWSCYTAEGDDAAGRSNLSQGWVGARAIDGYMEDPGSGNWFAGHRRYVLHPRLTTFGTGSTTGFNALWVGAPYVARPTGIEWIAWPSAGFVPKALVKPLFSLSNNQYPTADYRNVTVTVKVGTTSLPVTVHPQQNGYGDPTLTWQVTLPTGFSSSDADVKFDISVSGIRATPDGVVLPTRSYSSTAVVNDAAPPAAAWAPYDSWTDMVNQLFQQLLGRAPSPSERSARVAALTDGSQSPGDVIAALRGSSDHATYVDPVARLYRAYFLRIPDRTGLEHWIAQRRAGRSLRWISESFTRTPEFKTRYGPLTNAQFVDLVYRNVLGRAPDSAGLAHWTAELDSGRRGRGWVMLGFSESAEYKRTQGAEVTVAVLHILLLDRAPTTSEMNAGVAALDGGQTVADYAETLLPHAVVT